MTIDFSYSQTIQGNEIQLDLNTNISSIFSGISNFSASSSTTTANNNAFIFYESYTMSDITNNLAIGVAILAILLFFAGFFRGKLIALECLGLVQLIFLCLLCI